MTDLESYAVAHTVRRYPSGCVSADGRVPSLQELCPFSNSQNWKTPQFFILPSSFFIPKRAAALQQQPFLA